jgi:hypothetical protein
MSEHEPGRRDERTLSDDGLTPKQGFGRREFLTGGLAFAAGTIIVPRVARGLIGFTARPAVEPSGPTFTRWLRRREDFLRLYFEFYNLKLNDDGTKLVRVSATRDSYLVVHFPPQHVLEEALRVEAREGDPGIDPLPDPPLGSRLSGPSRLAFKIDAATNEIDFTPASLLDWSPYFASVVPAASLFRPEAYPAIRKPGPKETAIEMPWWLVLSTSEVASWTHRTDAHTFSGRTELWTTRLATSEISPPLPGRPRQRLVRAVWARDPGFGEFICKYEASPTATPAFPDGPFTDQSLEPTNRVGIVLQSADWGYKTTQGRTPKPIEARTLALSSLGASLDAEGDWWKAEPHPQASIKSWLHRASFGRDNVVRVETEGFLMPFGHRAVKVDISERNVHGMRSRPESAAAYLLKRTYYIVLEPEKAFPPPNEPEMLRQPNEGRAFPFKRLRAVTKITPELSPVAFLSGFGESDASVPTRGEKPYPFDFIGIDHVDRSVAFSSPVVFVASHLARDPKTAEDLAMAYNVRNDLRQVSLAGQLIAIAQSTNAAQDTSVESSTITFAADHPSDLSDADQEKASKALAAASLPAFWPKMAEMEVRLPVAERVASSTPGLTRIAYDTGYLSTGLDGSDRAYRFATLLDTDKAVSFTAGGRAGALANPDFTIASLSATHGPMADLAAIESGDFFDVDAKLLGSIALKDIIKPGLGFDAAPKLIERRDGQKLITELTWSPPLTSNGIFVADHPESALDVVAQYVSELDKPGVFTSSVVADMRKVAISFPATSQLFTVRLERLRYSSTNGGKPDVRVDVGDVSFGGELQLVEKLRDFLGPLLKQTAGQAGGPAVEASADGITATYTLPVPAVEVGVFLLQNLVVTAGLNIPFGKPARATYSFSSRENPFLLTVSALGGGGYLTVRAGVDELESIEGSLEFGGATKINLAVASGSLHALGGVTYTKSAGGGITLEGFFRMGGSLRVIGLITVSAEFVMTMKWVEAKKKVVGSAAITVEIDMGLWSQSVTVGPIKRAFGNKSADPSFGALYEPDDWNEYCSAFSEEPAS